MRGRELLDFINRFPFEIHLSGSSGLRTRVIRSMRASLLSDMHSLFPTRRAVKHNIPPEWLSDPEAVVRFLERRLRGGTIAQAREAYLRNPAQDAFFRAANVFVVNFQEQMAREQMGPEAAAEAERLAQEALDAQILSEFSAVFPPHIGPEVLQSEIFCEKFVIPVEQIYSTFSATIREQHPDVLREVMRSALHEYFEKGIINPLGPVSGSMVDTISPSMIEVMDAIVINQPEILFNDLLPLNGSNSITLLKNINESVSNISSVEIREAIMSSNRVFGVEHWESILRVSANSNSLDSQNTLETLLYTWSKHAMNTEASSAGKIDLLGDFYASAVWEYGPAAIEVVRTSLGF